jgi:23S rRNA pseudouridine1911/1915/1917 synthase
VSRLDSPVTGVLPLARTSKCASRLSEQFRNHSPQKTYWAIVEKKPSEPQGRVEHHLVRDERAAKTRIVKHPNRESKLGLLEYRVLDDCRFGTVLEIKLITGRKHQIRAQLEAIACPIVGDAKYSSRSSFPKGIALHCRSLCLEHPTTKSPVEWIAPVPAYWSI